MHAFLSSADFFFKIIVCKNSFRTCQGVKQFGSTSGQTFVGPDLGLNCLQRLSALVKRGAQQFIENHFADTTMGRIQLFVFNYGKCSKISNTSCLPKKAKTNSTDPV